MYLALSVEYGRDDQLIFAQQLGVDDVLTDVPSWDAATLETARNRIEKTGLRLAGVEGLDLGDEDAAAAALQAAAAAGVELVCSVSKGQEPERQPAGRGQALVGPVTQPPAPAPQTLAWLAKTAAAAGVRLAVPGTGPLQVEGPIGLDLTPDQLRADDLEAIMNEPQTTVFAVHLGNIAAGQQAFLDEGEINLPLTLNRLKKIGFVGPLRAAPPPGMIGDEPWGYKGRAFDLGYLKAVLQVLATP